MTEQNTFHRSESASACGSELNEAAYSTTQHWLRYLGCFLLFAITFCFLTKTFIKSVEYLQECFDGEVALDAALLFGVAYVLWHLYHDFAHCRHAAMSLRV